MSGGQPKLETNLPKILTFGATIQQKYQKITYSGLGHRNFFLGRGLDTLELDDVWNI
jgi:hypothetical protein